MATPTDKSLRIAAEATRLMEPYHPRKTNRTVGRLFDIVLLPPVPKATSDADPNSSAALRARITKSETMWRNSTDSDETKLRNLFFDWAGLGPDWWRSIFEYFAKATKWPVTRDEDDDEKTSRREQSEDYYAGVNTLGNVMLDYYRVLIAEAKKPSQTETSVHTWRNLRAAIVETDVVRSLTEYRSKYDIMPSAKKSHHVDIDEIFNIALTVGELEKKLA